MMFDVHYCHGFYIKITSICLRSLCQRVYDQQFGNCLYDLFTLPDTDLDPEPGLDICPKIGYSYDQGSGSRLESESESV